MADSQHELERDLQILSAELRKLETEYTMFFAKKLPRPPLETRARVEKLLRRYDRAYIQSSADRFRLTTLQNRFSTFADLWDRAIRAREEGRPGPFFHPRVEEPPPVEAPKPAPPASGEHVVCVKDPASEREKLLSLYESLMEARRSTGNQEALPFHRFAQMVKTQVDKLHAAGSAEVAFRVGIKDNKVTFTARGTKGGAEKDG